MKKMKLLPIAALLLAVAFSAFTNKALDVKQWRFDSNTLSNARIADFYTEDLGSVECSGNTLPCIIEVPHIGSNTDMEDLEDYLSSFSSDQDVKAAAISRKS